MSLACLLAACSPRAPEAPASTSSAGEGDMVQAVPAPPPSPSIVEAPAGATVPAPSPEPPMAETATSAAKSAPSHVVPPLPRARPASADEYKRALAERIHALSQEHVYTGTVPPLLRSIVVVQLSLDESGKATSLRVHRSNGIKALEERALDSMRRAAPYDEPVAALIDRKTRRFTFLETFLFRDDGKFQLRSLAPAS